MKRKITFLSAALMLLAFLAVPLGMRGQTTHTIGWGTASGEEGTYTNFTATSGEVAGVLSFITEKNSSQTNPAYNANASELRLYFHSSGDGGSITISPVSGITITDAVMTTSTSPSVAYYVDGGSAVSVSASNNTYTISGISASTSLKIQNVNTSNTQLRIKTIALTYTTDGTQPTTYTVTYHANVTGIDDVVDTYNEGANVTLRAANTFTNEGYTFEEWNTDATGDGDAYEAGYQIEGIDEDLEFYAIWTENTTPGGDEQWVLTSLTDLTENDVFVIVGNNGSNYAMSNSNGTSSAPATVAVTIENDAITSTVADNIQWTISGETDNYIFYPNGSTETWLYCTNTNNGVRVGTNSDNTFKIESGYLFHQGTSRYVGIYNSQDWRCYTSINSNIQGQTFAFYKKVTGGVTPPSIIAGNVEISYETTSGSISYSINNEPDPAGTISAEVTDGDWLTLGETPITFTCTVNEAATERTATVRLTYSYGVNQTVTKDVTVTQLGDPNVTPTIAEVRAQSTGSSVVTRGIVTSITGSNMKTAYIQDATAAIVVYGSFTAAVGDEIRVSGSLSNYNGLLEITSPQVTVISSGNTIEPQLMTVAEAVASENQGWYIRIENAIVSAISGQNTTIAQGESTIVVRGISGVEIAENDVISLNGNIGYYNGNQIANPQNVEVQAAPVEPSITVTPATLNVDAEEHLVNYLDLAYENIDVENASSFTVHYYNAEGEEIQLVPGEAWMIAGVTGSEAPYRVLCVIIANEGEARTAYFKVSAVDAENNTVYSNLVTVNQEAYVAPVPSITITPNTIDAPAEGAEGTLALAYENITDFISFDFYFCDANGGELEDTDPNYPDWIDAEIQVEDEVYSVAYTVNANEGEARTAYFKVYTPEAEGVYAIVTVNQAEYVVDYATLPFEFDGGRAAIANTDGLTQENLGSDYNNSPKLKFEKGNKDNDGLYSTLILKFNERPGTLTFDIKGNSFSGGTFKVQTSEDGVTYTDLESYTDLTTTIQSEEFTNLGENVRYIKWIYTEKVNGNVALGNINLAKYTEPEPSIIVTPATVSVDAGEHDGTLALTYENLTISDMTDFDIQYYDAEGEETDEPDWIEVLVAEQDPEIGEGYVVSYYMVENEGEARTAYFKVYAMDDEAELVYSNLVTVNQAAYVAPVELEDFAIFTGDLIEGDYLIVYDGYAMNNVVNSGRLQYEEVEAENDVISTDNAAIIWHIAPTDGGYWTIYSADANAYAASTGAKNKAQMLEDGTDDKALWTITGTETFEFVNKANSEGGVNANLRNNGTYGFACYAATTGGALTLYKKVTTTATYTLDITGYGDSENGGYYLIASPIYGLNPANVEGMTQGDFDLYYFDQTQGLEWINYETEDGINHFYLTPGKGYLYAHETDTTLTFTGMPYSGNGIIKLVKNDNANFPGWNLVGNPFGNAATIDKAYYRLNQYGSEVDPTTEQSAIAVMEGVFVVADTDEETVTFTEQTNPDNSNGVSQFSINVSMNRGESVDRAIVRFDNGNQLPKFQLNPNHTKVYFPQGENDYAIVRSANEGEMPVNFKAENNGTYTISINTENVEMNYLHLIDNMTGADVDLLATPSYSFEAKTTDYANRFRLVFNANMVNENGNETFAYFNGSEWVISNMGEATLQVVDLMGRVLSTETVNGNATMNLNQTPGVYMFRLVNGDSVKVQKVVVR